MNVLKLFNFRPIGLALVCLLWFGALVSQATNRYVVVPGTPGGTNTPPYDTWANAATQIQWAVDVATNSETVWVTNGNYTLTNQIVITNGIIVQSWNGKTNTFINGNYPATTNRCFFLSNTAAVVDGFTITNGCVTNEGGGGVFIFNGGTVRNCTINSNFMITRTSGQSYSDGGGAYLNGSGSILSNCFIAFNSCVTNVNGGGIALRAGRVVNCVVVSNCSGPIEASLGSGGGIFITADSAGMVINCTSEYNRARWGGGIQVGNASPNSVISNCVIRKNSASGYGGGIAHGSGWIIDSVISENTGEGVRKNAADATRIINCTIVGNTGGGLGGLGNGYIRNSLIANNYSSGDGAGIRITGTNFMVQNCTVVSNKSETQGGGVSSINTAGEKSIINSIIYSNQATTANPNWYTNASGATFTNCCTTPTNDLPGTGNISNYPALVNWSLGDYRLSADSPCINAGLNETWMTNSYDRDGRTRIRYGIVDMGAYERINEGTIYKLW